ncbi:Rho/RAC guanine nucleotide exchange factor, putative [Entamoeba invadens IP1]|uniref:Rho/RAC guanine nucleotide exchange factor, putative n=1 Tax=Entamoeba invadens IP1 TaxID=370355 RepID=A0A0A1U492_ENTIV|nr:Rho/RAC guanine nucleotide exchange factor, putative [Entamoeba invadens IP1]ELP86511.1 Rho/RAC guanine nucleotide exchange factor, putative [Entamoeba invadens IP1]|eukprot:XP_004185857.1 Rho/RAC guanine nucleotide exchange factor, putative [Entamoeba invadens IP1]
MSFNNTEEQQLLEWVRKQLPTRIVSSVTTDFRDGHVFVELAALITKTSIPKIEPGTTTQQKMNNVDLALQIVTNKFGKLEGVSIQCIVNGNRDQTLDFINHLKRIVGFEKLKRIQQNQKIRKDLKAFEEKTKMMRNTVNFSLVESGSSSMFGRKSAFISTKSGVEMKRCTVIYDDAQYPRINPQRASPTKTRTIELKKQKGLCRKVGIRNGSFESKKVGAPNKEELLLTTSKLSAEGIVPQKSKGVITVKPPELIKKEESHQKKSSFTEEDDITLPEENNNKKMDEIEDESSSEPSEEESSSEENYIELDDKEQNELMKCVVKRVEKEDTNGGDPNIKKIKNNVFKVKNVYYVVSDVVNGENILSPLNLSVDATVSCIQSILRTKVLSKTFSIEIKKEQKNIQDISRKAQKHMQTFIKVQAMAKGYFFRKSKLARKMKDLKYAVREIVESERSYFKDLNIIQKMIDKTLELSPKSDIVHQAKLVIGTMITCNSMLLKTLEEMIKKDPFGKTLHLSFSTFTKYLTYYTTYMNIYLPLKTFYESDSNKSIVKTISKHFLNDLEPDNYLMRPIQRPPRYKLLMDAVVSALPEWWQNQKELKTCSNTLREAVFHLNTCMKKNNDQRAVDELLSKLSFPKKFLLEKDTQRRIVYQGFLSRKQKGKKDDEFCCFLFNDYLVFAKVRREDVGDIPSETLKNKSKVYHVIDMRQVTLMDVPSEESTFCINIPQKLFLLKAENEDNKLTWMHQIDGVFALQQQKMLVRLSSLNSSIPPLDISVFNQTEYLIHPDYEETIFYFNQANNNWEQVFMMLQKNVVCMFVNAEEAATLKQPTLVFDILQLKFKGVQVSQRKYTFEVYYKNFTYIFATNNNNCKFVWLSLLRNSFYTHCKSIMDLNSFGINEFSTDLLKTWTVFDDILPDIDSDHY